MTQKKTVLYVNNTDYFTDTWMNVVDHDRRRIPSVGRCVRSLDLEGPQVCFWVHTRAIHQRQTGQEQHLLLMLHGAECRDVHSDGIDAVQVNKKL